MGTCSETICKHRILFPSMQHIVIIAGASPGETKKEGCGTWKRWFLPRDAMHKRGLCRHAVSVRPSVTFVDHVKTNNTSSNFFHHRVATRWWKKFHSTPFQFFHTKRGGDIPTGTPLTGASNAGGVGRNRDSERLSGSYGISSMPVYRVTLIGVFLDHFRINLHQTCTQYSNEGPQHRNAARFPKNTF